MGVHRPRKVGSLFLATRLQRSFFTKKRISANNYQFVRGSTTTETPAIESLFRDANEVDSDSEWNPARADECQTTAVQTDNEARSTPPTERQTEKPSFRETHNPTGVR